MSNLEGILVNTIKRTKYNQNCEKFRYWELYIIVGTYSILTGNFR